MTLWGVIGVQGGEKRYLQSRRNCYSMRTVYSRRCCWCSSSGGESFGRCGFGRSSGLWWGPFISKLLFRMDLAVS